MTTSSGTGGAAPECTTDADCAGNPAGKVCDTAKGDCVGCLPSNDTCPVGQYCDPTKNTCGVGCTDDTDCDPANDLFCDTAAHTCVGCVTDMNCPAGSICIAKTCVPGCTDAQPCQLGFSCCSSVCFDLVNDPEHCGDCNNVCPEVTHAATSCVNGACGTGACDPGWANCDGDLANGCEHNELQDGPCACMPGTTQSCYFGGMGTQNVGPCKAGTQMCKPDGLSWGDCLGQVLPSSEICGNNIDENCDGMNDNAPDVDGDGWGRCQGDCCDSASDGCIDPKLVNPGAYDFGGNNFDDDCDGVKDNAVASCDANLASNSATGLDYAKAIDLCSSTTENPPIQQKKWGVITSSLFLANGAGSPAAVSRSIRQGFGTGISPLKGSRIAVISTGNAAAQAAPNNANPAYAAFEIGQDTLTSSPVPADWLAANGGNFPNAPGCPAPSGGTTARNPVMLKVRVRAPTNAKSFNVSVNFMSAEYPEWVCTQYNDFFLTLLDSTFVPGPGETANPIDKNLAFYDPPPAGPPFYPVGVNLASGNTGLFSQCKNGQIGCSGVNPSNINTCVSQAQLAGTGFDLAGNACGANDRVGGGTGWLVTSGNVKPGETIEVRFVIWDTSDGVYDSVALIDNFVWSAAPAQPGTHN
jgi:hypothetical protein